MSEEITVIPELVQPIELARPKKQEIQTDTAKQQSTEVFAGMGIARMYPRDEQGAWDAIVQSCKRPTFATKALYKVPRGGKELRGPGIRLAELMAQKWGNIKHGIRVLDYQDRQSRWEAYAMDLQTLDWHTQEFVVKHERFTKGGTQRIDNPDEIKMIASAAGSKALRQCILKILPADLVDSAYEVCVDTLTPKSTIPIEKQIADMVKAFKKIKVTDTMIEGYTGVAMAALTEDHLDDLRGIYSAITSGESHIEDHFEIPTVEMKEPA